MVNKIFMMNCRKLSLLLLSIFLLSPSTSAIEMTALKGKSFTMLCYDSGSNDDGLYIDLKFTPTGSTTSRDIARYILNTKETKFYPDYQLQYQGRFEFAPANNFTLKDIVVDDEGMYQCIARSLQMLGEATKSNNLEVYIVPSIVLRPLNSPLIEGSGPVQAAECVALNAKPAANVTWDSSRHLHYSQNFTTSVGSEPSSTDSKATMTVSPNKFYNNQPFMCIIKHPALPNRENVSIIELNVRYPPGIPSIRVINDNTQLTCSSDGNPSPTITWIMPNNNPAPEPVEGSSTVRIIGPNLPERQNDTYTCKASNGVGLETEASITTHEAVEYKEIVKTSNTGLIAGVVVGTIVLLAIIAVLVYWFFIRKQREKDSGPYNPQKISRQTDDEGGWSRSSGRPMIQHANESLNKNAPPSPTRPPPQEDEEEDGSNYSRSDVEEFTEGHDVDLNSPLTGDDEDMPTAGIVSKNSVNFQHRRQRPSTSPHRMSQNKGQPQPTPRTPLQSDPHYEVPPKEYYEDEYDQEDDRLIGQHHPDEDPMDDRFYDRPEDRYPGYQPRYDEPPHDEHLPPYTDTVQYASIDHSYNAGKPRTRPPYQEPVEYAEIRSKGQIV